MELSEAKISVTYVISHKLCFHYTKSDLIILYRRHYRLSEYPNIKLM